MTMVCVLPGWATHIIMVNIVVLGLLVGLGVFAWFGRIGRRRHPGNFRRRHNWYIAGIAVAVFFAFPLVVGVTISEVVRPLLCESIGEYQHRPGDPRY